MRDPYEVLQVPRTASADEIKSAYRRLARKHHPDVNPHDQAAEERFKEVSHAYEILSDPEKRQRFDQFGVAEPQSGSDFFGGAGGFEEIFDMFFGGTGTQNRTRRGGSRGGEDVRADLTIGLKDVLHGATRPVTFRKRKRCGDCGGSGSEGGKPPKSCEACEGTGQVTRVQQVLLGAVRMSAPCTKCGGNGQVIEAPCQTCRGHGQVAAEESLDVVVPPGIEHGVSIRYSGQGGDGIGSGRPGDLFVVVSVEEDERFHREGTDLHTVASISFVQATLGDEIDFEGLDETARLHVPPGTQPGTVLRVRGLGLPRLHGGARGDLLVEVQVRIPKKVSPAQEKLLKEFATLSGEELPKGPGNLFENLFRRRG